MTFPIRSWDMPIRRGLDDTSTPESGPPTVGRRRGRVITWNPFDLTNVIEVDGVEYENIPCLNSLDSLVMLPGDRVEIITYSGLWYVIGRITAPGSEDALRILRFLQGIQDENLTAGGTASATYADLSTGGVGPAVSFDVPPSGQVWVGISAYIQATASGGGSNNVETVHMGFELSGANELAAHDDRSISASAAYTGSPATGVRFIGSVSNEFLLTGLVPGATSFVAKYRVAESGTGTKVNSIDTRRIRVRGA